MLKGRVRFLTILLIIAVLAFPTSALASSYSLDLFEEAFEYILDAYVDELTPEELEEMAVKGMMQQLDRYSQYFNATELKEFHDDLDGTFGGVGMQIERLDDYITVIAPLPDTPAEKAGVLPGDKIIKVDDQDIVGYTLAAAVNLIRGEPGTSVKLTIMRNGGDTLTITIVRDIIELLIVESEMLEHKIGYIKLTNFTMDSPDKFRENIDLLKAQGARGIILDLRNNPGGLLNAALSVASIFVDYGEDIVHVESRTEGSNSYYSVSPGLGLPLVVLINGGTASGSEIVAGAIQDYELGTLVGTNSFGKASVQVLHELSNGTAVKITSAQYLTPLRRQISSVGIEPDIIVEDREEQLKKAKEVLLEKIGGADLGTISFSVGSKQAYFNSNQVLLREAPYMSNGSVMVPIRDFAEALGAKISFENDVNKVTAVKENHQLDIYINSDSVIADGQVRQMPANAAVKKGVTFIPVRYFAEFFGAVVNWDNGRVWLEMLDK